VLGDGLVHGVGVIGGGYGGLGASQKKHKNTVQSTSIDKTVSTMKNKQIMFEEGARDVEGTAIRGIQKEMNDLTQENRRLNKHVDLQVNLIAELGGEVPEMETAADESDSSPPPTRRQRRKHRSVVPHVRSGRKLIV